MPSKQAKPHAPEKKTKLFIHFKNKSQTVKQLSEEACAKKTEGKIQAQPFFKLIWLNLAWILDTNPELLFEILQLLESIIPMLLL